MNYHNINRIFDAGLLLGYMADRTNRIKEVLVIQNKIPVWPANKLENSKTAMTSICNNKSQPHLKDLKKIALIRDVDIGKLQVTTKKANHANKA